MRFYRTSQSGDNAAKRRCTMMRGKHYNYFRDYDPAVGRYLLSDPIGLDGGTNTYGYVGSAPLQWTDADGLRREGDEGGRGAGAAASFRPRPEFSGLNDHAARHGNGASRGAYYQDALNNIERGRPFNIKHDGQWKTCYVTRLGPDEFKFTSTTANGRNILTHFNVTTRYLNDNGIQLPKGF